MGLGEAQGGSSAPSVPHLHFISLFLVSFFLVCNKSLGLEVHVYPFAFGNCSSRALLSTERCECKRYVLLNVQGIIPGVTGHLQAHLLNRQ